MEPRHKKAAVGGAVLAAGSAGVLAVSKALFDWSAWGIEATSLLIPAVMIPVLFYLRQFTGDNIPKALLPLVAVALGTAGDYFHSVTFGGAWGVVAGTALGALGDVFYTVAKELSERFK